MLDLIKKRTLYQKTIGTCFFLTIIYSSGQFFSASASSTPSAKPYYKLWETAANAELIVEVKVNKIIQITGDMATINVEIASVLKGSPERKIIVLSCGKPYVSCSKIKDFRNTHWLAFLRRFSTTLKAMNNGGEPYIYCFVDEHGAQVFNEKDLTQLRMEIKNQRKINEDFAMLDVATPDSWDPKITTLLNGLLKPTKQSSALRSLVNLPRAAMPALIRAMKDHRALPSLSHGEEVIHLEKDITRQLIDIAYRIEGQGMSSDAWRVWLWYGQRARAVP